MTENVGLAVLVADTGESARTIQNWCDLGILKPSETTHKRGRGTHREFYAPAPWHGERTWALIASALCERRMPLGDVKDLMDSLRELTGMNVDEPTGGWEKSMRSDPIGAALLGDLEALLIIPGEKSWARLVKDQPKAEDIEPDIWPAGAIFNKEEWRSYPDIPLAAPYDFIAHYKTAIFLNLTLTLAPLRATKAA